MTSNDKSFYANFWVFQCSFLKHYHKYWSFLMNNNFLSSILYKTFKLVLFGSIYKLWILQFSTAIVGTDKTTLTQCCMQNQAQVVCSVGQSVAENIFDIFNQYLAVSKYFGCFTDLVAQEVAYQAMDWKFRTSNPNQVISYLSISHTVCLCHDDKYLTHLNDFFARPLGSASKQLS